MLATDLGHRRGKFRVNRRNQQHHQASDKESGDRAETAGSKYPRATQDHPAPTDHRTERKRQNVATR
jgi:hypothetical protein